MVNTTTKPQDDPEYQLCLKDLERITFDFLRGLRFIALNAGRAGKSWDENLSSHVFHDILETAGGVLALAREGVSNIGKRELRFLIELTIKVCYVEQKFGSLSLQAKIKAASGQLDNANIGIKRDLYLTRLDANLQEPFRDELGRLYGSACDWVHLTVEQLKDRIDRGNRGITAGMEGSRELRTFISLAERSYAAALVLLLHSVPKHVAGDLLVESDGSSFDWHFQASKFIASIDAHHDYKAERQANLSQVQELRAKAIRF